MKPIKFLEGERVYLRPVTEEDFELVYEGKNSAIIVESLFLFSPLTTSQIKSELQKMTVDEHTKIFTICSSDNDEAIGQTALVRIDYISRAAVFYIAIYNPEFWSKGIGGESTELMLKYAFDVLNLNRVQLHVSTKNEKGVKTYKRAGFKIEGTLRSAMYRDNDYIDFYVMGILREEYYSKIKGLLKIE
ncbi:MAG: GNAT family N-acetyltransferase [Bacteroidetes bacterium]|nr:GNAT family N-acetyltransferase [Bacteroidota bacterium]MBU1677575.1 GNAT family N-acetyltransferase [Bacteroidota bacterium]MBU2505769.1 GNAT family N-acetyltransferase [Bacteroidota bacterium]